MKMLEKLAIIFFDYVDKFFHQQRIIRTLKREVSNLNNFIDVGAYKGTYTDLILNNFKPKKVLMFEPLSMPTKTRTIMFPGEDKKKLSTCEEEASKLVRIILSEIGY